ncbi:lens fiber membrane intrinsic protein-like [Hydractinia symbiolongicarpus]|uniref:lens fiber membrane intrinsic protein-like n=1 Tax=Hydractinia symbiolongicarpus TaxID=13093 RepID=UPI00254A6026|nr:lens fiber membrane intrinsic protein-like [Hydractinia symbiolongicarpus]
MALGKICFLVSSILAGIFISSGAGGNQWLKIKTNKYVTKHDIGLWKVCGELNCKTIGNDLGDKEKWYKATRAFAVISCLVIIAGIILAILALVSDKVKSIIGGILMFCGGGCMLVALAIFTDKQDFDSIYFKYQYGWSYIIGWIGVAVSIVSGVLGIMAEKF